MYLYRPRHGEYMNKETHLGASNDNYLTKFLLYFDLQSF